MSQTPRMVNALRQFVVSKRCARISPPLEGQVLCLTLQGRGCCTPCEHPGVWTLSLGVEICREQKVCAHIPTPL